MTDLPDLVAWLRAQIDEDERVARNVDPQGWTEAIEAGHWNELDPTEYAHIARHDPARVLAEVAAKRALMQLAQGMLEEADVQDRHAELSIYEESGECQRTDATYLLRLLAQPYAGREGWREEWATGGAAWGVASPGMRKRPRSMRGAGPLCRLLALGAVAGLPGRVALRTLVLRCVVALPVARAGPERRVGGGYGGAGAEHDEAERGGGEEALHGFTSPLAEMGRGVPPAAWGPGGLAAVGEQRRLCGHCAHLTVHVQPEHERAVLVVAGAARPQLRGVGEPAVEVVQFAFGPVDGDVGGGGGAGDAGGLLDCRSVAAPDA